MDRPGTITSMMPVTGLSALYRNDVNGGFLISSIQGYASMTMKSGFSKVFGVITREESGGVILAGLNMVGWSEMNDPNHGSFMGIYSDLAANRVADGESAILSNRISYGTAMSMPILSLKEFAVAQCGYTPALLAETSMQELVESLVHNGFVDPPYDKRAWVTAMERYEISESDAD
ncbi:hypothetical protein ACWEWD_34445 [Streptomyces tendae]